MALGFFILKMFCLIFLILNDFPVYENEIRKSSSIFISDVILTGIVKSYNFVIGLTIVNPLYLGK